MKRSWRPEHDEVHAAVCALARSADLFRGVLLELIQGRPAQDVLGERAEPLRLANEVLEHWLGCLGIARADGPGCPPSPN
jgi:hypothetical protein